MEKLTQETAIALLQQNMTTLTAAMTRIELKIDKIDESTRNYVTMDDLKKNYVSIEQHNSVKEKVNLILKILYGVIGALGLEALNVLSQFFTKK